MYNTNFFPQIEKFRRHLWGAGVDSIDARGVSADNYGRYVPKEDVVMVECHEDVNGEWVPNPVVEKRAGSLPSPSKLEGTTDSK